MKRVQNISRYNKIGKDGSLNEVEVPYSAMYVAQNLVKNISERSLFHLANSSSVRRDNYFVLNQDIEVYGNMETNGIDGSMSALSDRPLALETFTDKETDAESIRKILEPYKSKEELTLRRIVAQHTLENVKSIVRKAMESAR